MRRSNRFTILLVSTALVTMGIAAAPALAAPEDSFIAKINAERTSRGLAPLQEYWDLTDDAEAHSKRMMDTGDLHHNPNLAHVTSGWEALAENVGVGRSVDRLHELFMESDGHRKNILGNYNYVGVGVKVESDTKMWVTVVFMRGPADLLDPTPTTTAPPPPTTTSPPPPPTAPPTTTVPPAPTTTRPPAPATTVAPVPTTTTAPVATVAVSPPAADPDAPVASLPGTRPVAH
jgi:hypothetical protein